MTLWLYLNFPTLQLDTLFSTSEELPICILEKQHIVQMNQTAQKRGLKLGMGLGSAASLCSDLQVHAYDSEIEKKKLEEIAHWLYVVTSDISLCPPAGILLKVSNMLTLYQGLAAYWEALHRHLKSLNVSFSFATGYSPLAAKLLAQTNFNHISDDNIWLQKQLGQQRLVATELPEKMVEKLNRVGIRHLKELLCVDIAEIARRFDIDLVNYIGRLSGQFKHPVDFYYPPETFKRYLELLFEIDNIQWIEKPLNKLLSQLEAFLKIRDQTAYELILTLHQRDGLTQTCHLSSAQGDYLAEKWMRLSQLTLESVRLNAPVIGITLASSQVTQQQSDSPDLFNGQQGSLSPLELISLLQAKLGKEQVNSLRATNDPRPENASQLCQPLQNKNTAAKEAPVKSKNVRPSILLPSPIPLIEKVTILQGPERLSTGWWDANEVIRDYFVAKSTQGRWLWVFRNQHKQWFVHGLFS